IASTMITLVFVPTVYTLFEEGWKGLRTKHAEYHFRLRRRNRCINGQARHSPDLPCFTRWHCCHRSATGSPPGPVSGPGPNNFMKKLILFVVVFAVMGGGYSCDRVANA